MRLSTRWARLKAAWDPSNLIMPQSDYDKLLKDHIGAMTAVEKIASAYKKESLQYKAQIEELIKKDVVDILSLKDYYEEKYGESTWFYRNRDVSKYLEHDPGACIEFARKVAKESRIKASDAPTVMVTKSLKYFLTIIDYEDDIRKYGQAEYWASAEETISSLEGDCDDWAILFNVTMFYIFQLYNKDAYWRLKLTVSNTVGEGYHAYNLWLHDDGEWYVAESTFYLKTSLEKKWLNTPMKHDNMYFDWWGFARVDRSFDRFSSYSKRVINSFA